MSKIRLKPDDIRVELLNDDNKHLIDSFSSSVCKELDDFLKENAWEEQRFGYSKTYLFFHDEKLAGYATLLTDSQKFHKSKNPFLKPLRKKTICEQNKNGYGSVPALKIGRLCVADKYNSQLEASNYSCLGTIMFSSILKHALELSNKVGCRLITTHAKKSTGAFRWYLKLGFIFSFNTQKTKEQLAREEIDSIPMFYDLKRMKG